MSNKTIIEFGYRIIWRIMEIEEGVILWGRTQPHSLINVIKITCIFLTKKEKEKILILAPLNPFRFFGSLYISKEWTSSIKTIASIIGLPPRRYILRCFCMPSLLHFLYCYAQRGPFTAPQSDQTYVLQYSGTPIKRLMAKDRRYIFARRCNRRSFVISRFFSVYFSVTSRWYILYYIILCLLLFFILKTANTSNVQTRRLYTYAVNQSTLSSTTKSICFLQIHCILQR